MSVSLAGSFDHARQFGVADSAILSREILHSEFRNFSVVDEHKAKRHVGERVGH